ncbi:DJ-1/PfpI family protein [Patescibacteria group bacterium]|nr:DJ-1/PfpI family protein [Patescibacteria group bacterium]
MFKRVVLIIAPENYREEELFHTLKEVETSGIGILIASKKIGTCIGQVTKTKTESLASLEMIKVDDYDGIIFIGGFGSSVFFEDEKAKSLAIDFYAANKVVAAICIAPSILANAGLLKGKTVTAYESEKDNLEKHGANFTGNKVEQDGLIITANGPEAAHKFGKTIALALT